MAICIYSYSNLCNTIHARTGLVLTQDNFFLNSVLIDRNKPDNTTGRAVSGHSMRDC